MASIASQSTDFKDFDLNSLTEVECKKLVLLLLSVHSAKNKMLMWTGSNAQYSSSVRAGLLLSNINGDTLFNLLYSMGLLQYIRQPVGREEIIKKVLLPDNRKKSIILFDPAESPIGIYRICQWKNRTDVGVSVPNDDYIGGNVPMTIYLDKYVFKKTWIENVGTISLDTDNNELKNFFIVSSPYSQSYLTDDELEKEMESNPRGLSKKSKDYNYWAAFSGFIERNYNVDNYSKWKNPKCEVTVDNKKVQVNQPTDRDGKPICPYCGGIIERHDIDVDHCWSLKYNKLLGVLDDECGYVASHGKCNREKSDKLYFPSQATWDILVSKIGATDLDPNIRNYRGIDEYDGNGNLVNEFKKTFCLDRELPNSNDKWKKEATAYFDKFFILRLLFAINNFHTHENLTDINETLNSTSKNDSDKISIIQDNIVGQIQRDIYNNVIETTQYLSLVEHDASKDLPLYVDKVLKNNFPKDVIQILGEDYVTQLIQIITKKVLEDILRRKHKKFSIAVGNNPGESPVQFGLSDDLSPGNTQKETEDVLEPTHDNLMRYANLDDTDVDYTNFTRSGGWDDGKNVFVWERKLKKSGKIIKIMLENIQRVFDDQSIWGDMAKEKLTALTTLYNYFNEILNEYSFDIIQINNIKRDKMLFVQEEQRKANLAVVQDMASKLEKRSKSGITSRTGSASTTTKKENEKKVIPTAGFKMSFKRGNHRGRLSKEQEKELKIAVEKMRKKKRAKVKGIDPTVVASKVEGGKKKKRNKKKRTKKKRRRKKKTRGKR